MSRDQFLGRLDSGIITSLLANYDAFRTTSDTLKFNVIKHDDDLTLIEVDSLLTSNECDEIVAHLDRQTFENMSHKYDTKQRNNSRLIVIDEQLAAMLWQRLSCGSQLERLVSSTTPLGFNVQGQWEFSRVNIAMRVNKYNNDEHFAPHKDAQYAPSGDERSLFSLLIYLTDRYEQGETKFYFPKVLPRSSLKGLTINEEIAAHGGLESGYECVMVKAKKGRAVLFTHNLLHEAAPAAIDQIPRMVLRSDVLVQRKQKPLGFALCSEEKEDYLACLNFFRQAQQNELEDLYPFRFFSGVVETGELYERALSIRYCYPRLLEAKTNRSVEEEEPLIHRCPPEIWLHIFRYIHEQDIRNLVFAYPQFQLLKLVWEAKEKQHLATDPHRPQFLPTIAAQYGSRTLFRFADAAFFHEHAHACCRVAAVYAFFLLGHGQDSRTYTVRYDRHTHDVCDVPMEKLLADAFYNRNCYGSLYRVQQVDDSTRQPVVDLDASVDRTYMINRHQSQFIGEDLVSRLHLRLQNLSPSADYQPLHTKYEDCFTDDEFLGWQRRHALYDQNGILVDRCLNLNGWSNRRTECVKDSVLGYREHLLNQTDRDSGTNLFRMLSAKDEVVHGFCDCFGCSHQVERVNDFIRVRNHLIFDFETHQLTVERLPDETEHMDYSPLLYTCVQTLQETVPPESPIAFYRVNVEKLATESGGFNHAACQCQYPSVRVDQFSLLDYTYLSHVHLAVAQNEEQMFVLATYGGIAAF